MPLKVVPHRRSENLYLRGTVRGQSVFETTGTSDPAAAEAIRIKRESDLLTVSIFGAKSTSTFMDAALKYREGGGSHRYLGSYDDSTGKWSLLLGHFGATKLLSITQDDLDSAARKLYPDTSAATRNRCVYTPFVAVWTYAAADGLCDKRTWRRPSERKGTRSSTKPRRRGTVPVSYEHAADFLAQMTTAPGIVMTILFYSGLRPIELFSMQSDDIMPDRLWMIVNSSKNDGEPRGVPMHRCLVPLMRALKARGGALVRTQRGTPYEMQDEHVGGGQMKSAINGAARRSGVKDISPYTARHTVSTQLVIAGVHPHAKDQILGHAVTDMSRRYTHVPQATLIEAINLLPVPAKIAELPWLARTDEVIGKARLPKLSIEARLKISASRRRATGKPHTPERRENIRKAMLARRAEKSDDT
ncbi:MAG: tyrosine-type recombinase/integrase [Pseudomonadota bacterium]